MCMLKSACSCGLYSRLPKWPCPLMTSDPSLECSVNTTLSGARIKMLISVGIPIIKIRPSGICLIFIMVIPIPGKTVFIQSSAAITRFLGSKKSIAL